MDTEYPMPDEEHRQQIWSATYLRSCPSRTVMEVISGKWPLYVLAALRLHDRPMRFSELRRFLDGITQKVLSSTLRSLERDGLLQRTVYPTVPPRVEYGLTELGVGAAELTAALTNWSVAHAKEILTARQCYDARDHRSPAPVPHQAAAASTGSIGDGVPEDGVRRPRQATKPPSRNSSPEPVKIRS
jgi:DNA-binding HxlR family transcriptional regulator